MLPVSARGDIVDLVAAHVRPDPNAGLLGGGRFGYHVHHRWLLEARSLRFGESLSFRYRVVVVDPGRSADLLRELGAIEGVYRVVLDLAEEAAEGE